MRYYIIAGEPSGDLHASNLMKYLKEEDKEYEFRFWGGDLMKKEGGELVRHYNAMAYMGLIDVISNLDKIKANFKLCKADLLDYKPDVLILVDYPGFNLRMAEFAHKRGIKVFYYISPKIWAWNTGRVKKIKAFVDKMFTILPFETDFYKRYNVPIEYIGNPVLDAISEKLETKESTETFLNKNKLDNKPIIALLAGSRNQELKYILPEMVKMQSHFPDYQFVIAGAPSFTISDYEPFIQTTNIKVIFEQTYDLLQHAHSALVTSGTATLETALLNCPQIVCYKMWGGKYAYKFAKRFIIKVDFISLVNLILNKEAVKEMVQKDLNETSLKEELNLLINNDNYRNNIFENYKKLKQIMGHPGSSKKAAIQMIKSLTK